MALTTFSSSNIRCVKYFVSRHIARTVPKVCQAVQANVHTSRCVAGLMEFFDKKDNWGEETITVGRPWKQEELRIKSNEDLHKLWYILLKERNMLMTMEHEYKRECELFPCPERMEKVEESMENLLSVVNERNEAVDILHTGGANVEKFEWKMNFLGIWYKRKVKEHMFPSYMNKSYVMSHPPFHKFLIPYLRLYREKYLKLDEKKERKERRHKKLLKEKFPHMEDED